MKFRMLCFLAVLVVVAHAAVRHAAIVTAVQGSVTMQGKPIKLASRLDQDARLEVPSGATVTVVYLSDSHKETLTGPGVLVVGGKSQGNLESKSGPGAIAVRTDTNSKGAAASLRSESNPTQLGIESIRTGEDGNAEIVFWTDPSYNSTVTVDKLAPYDESTGKPGANLQLPEELKSAPLQLTHEKPMADEPAGHEHLVVSLKMQLTQGSPYRIHWVDDDTMGPNEHSEWIVLLAPERENALLDMKRWAYAPVSPEKLLCLVQVACEWQDLDSAVQAASRAYEQDKSNEEARQVYRKMLVIDERYQEAENIAP